MKKKRNFNSISNAVLIAALSAGVILTGPITEKSLVNASETEAQINKASPTELIESNNEPIEDDIEVEELLEDKVDLANAEDDSQEDEEVKNDEHSNDEDSSAKQTDEINTDINSSDEITPIEVIEDTSTEIIEPNEEALDAVNILPNLSQEDKKTYLDRLKNTTSAADIDQVIADAKAQDELLNHKGSSKYHIENYSGLGENDKNNFQARIGDATSIEEVNNILKEAKTKSRDKLPAARKLYKIELISVVNSNDYLTDDEKNHYTDNIDKHYKDSIIEGHFKDAMDRAYSRKQLHEITVRTKDKLRDANLSDEQRKDIEERVLAGGNTVDIYAIILNDIEKAEAKHAKNLATAKEDTVKELYDLRYLSVDEIKNISIDIENAQTIEEINRLINQAKETNTGYSNKIVDEAKAKIKALSRIEDKKQDFIERIYSAKSQDEIENILEEAKVLATERLSEEEANALKNAKKDALDKLSEFNYLVEDGSAIYNSYQDEIHKASSIEELEPILKRAQAENADFKIGKEKLKEAQTKAKNAIDELENLNPNRKADFRKSINEARSLEEVEKLVEEYLAEDNKNKKAAAQLALNKQKEHATEILEKNNKYLDLTETESYLKLISEAESMDEVLALETQILEQVAANAEARGLNEKNKPSQPGGGDNTNTGGGDNSTPGGEDNNIPGGDDTNQPGGGDNTQPGTGGTYTTVIPGTEDTNQPDGGTSAETGGTENPGTDGNSTSGEGTTPGENTTVTPGTGGDSIPGTDTPVTPGTDNNPTPGENTTGGSTGGSIGGLTGGSNGGSTGNTGGSGSTGGTSNPTETPTPNPTPAVSEKSELEKSKEDAKQTIKDLPALTEAEKGALVEEVVKADSKEAVDKLLTDAKAKDLDKTKDEAKAAIDKLEAISEEDKKVYVQRVDKANDKEEVAEVVDEAKKVDSDKKSNTSNSGAENSADGKADAEKDPKEDKGTGGKKDSKDNNAPDGKTPDAEGDVDVADKEGGHSSKPDAETPGKADADEDALGDGDRKDTKTTSPVAPTSEKNKGYSAKKLNPKTGIESLTSVATTLIISVAALGKFRKRKYDK